MQIFYGLVALDHFPFADNSGIFQARVDLDLDTFLFSSAWPALTDTPLTLLFENKALSFSASKGENDGVAL